MWTSKVSRNSIPAALAQVSTVGRLRPFTQWFESQRVEDLLARCNANPRPWLTLFSLLMAIQVSPWLYANWDGNSYMSISRNLLRGAGMQNLGNPQPYYAPGYPIILMPAFLFGDRPFLAIHLIHLLMALLMMAGVYRWAQRYAAPAALFITGLVMLNVSVWIHFRRIESDIPFTAIAVWSAISLNHVFDATSSRVAMRRAAGSALLLTMLSLVREVGVALVMGFGLRAMLEVCQRRLSFSSALVRTCVVAIPPIAAVASFVAYDAAMSNKSDPAIGSHLGYFIPAGESVLPRLVEGFRIRSGEIGRLMIPGMFNSHGPTWEWLDINVAIYFVLFVALAVGWWRFVKREQEVYALTLPFYFVIYVVWAYDVKPRYMIPMLPVMFASLWILIEPFRRWRLTFLAALLIGHLGVALGYWMTRDLPRARACATEWPTVLELSDFIRSRSAPDLSDTGLVMVSSREDCISIMMTHVLDRRVRRVDVMVGIPLAEIKWLVTPLDESAPAGFDTITASGHYKLLRRR